MAHVEKGPFSRPFFKGLEKLFPATSVINVLIGSEHERTRWIISPSDAAVELQEDDAVSISKVVFDAVSVIDNWMDGLRGSGHRFICSLDETILVGRRNSPPAECREQPVTCRWLHSGELFRDEVLYFSKAALADCVFADLRKRVISVLVAEESFCEPIRKL